MLVCAGELVHQYQIPKSMQSLKDIQKVNTLNFELIHYYIQINTLLWARHHKCVLPLCSCPETPQTYVIRTAYLLMLPITWLLSLFPPVPSSICLWSELGWTHSPLSLWYTQELRCEVCKSGQERTTHTCWDLIHRLEALPHGLSLPISRIQRVWRMIRKVHNSSVYLGSPLKLPT